MKKCIHVSMKFMFILQFFIIDMFQILKWRQNIFDLIYFLNHITERSNLERTGKERNSSIPLNKFNKLIKCIHNN